MITKCFCETSGSCGVETSGSLGYFAPNRSPHRSPIDKINDKICQQKACEKSVKESQEIQAILNKPTNERNLEEKIKLAKFYSSQIISKLPKSEPKYVV